MNKNALILTLVLAIIVFSGCVSSGPADDTPVNNTSSRNKTIKFTVPNTDKIYDLNVEPTVQNVCIKNYKPEWGKVIDTDIDDNSGYRKKASEPSLTVTFENGHTARFYGFTESENLRKAKFEVNISLNCGK